jgi:hypothetical protein
MALTQADYDAAANVWISDIPAESESGGFWASLISNLPELAGIGLAAYNISQGAASGTVTTKTGTTVTTGTSATSQANNSTILVIGIIIILALFLTRK